VAIHTGTGPFPANTAYFFEPRARDRGDPFRRNERIAGSKLDLRSPNRTGDVDPVIVGGALQCLPWIYRPVGLLLLLAVVVGNLLSLLPFHLLTLTILVGFLLVGCDFGCPHKVVSRMLDGAEDALVVN
jgi:hypothetical protein